MNVRPAGREPCSCSSPINQILERLDQMDADIASAQQAANTAVGTAASQAGVAAASAASAAQDASDALGHAAAAQQSADDALLEATAAAGSAQDAADDLADALLAIQNIESTIASVLANDIGAKVDKLTTAGFHLYSHTGSTQGEVAPDINPTAATIPIRDSSGRLQAADPASGATDKTLVTANWVSQTGDSAPNNLIHKTGNETKQGNLTMVNDMRKRVTRALSYRPASYLGLYPQAIIDPNDDNIIRYRLDFEPNLTGVGWQLYNSNNQGTRKSVQLTFIANHNTGNCSLQLVTSIGSYISLASWTDPDLVDQ